MGLLQRALGMGGHVKYSGGQGKLAKAAAAASSGSQSVSAIGQMYSDAGLLGALVVCEAAFNKIENMGSQVLMSGEVMPAEKVPELIAGITTADVQAAAKKLSSAKLSMGACGNLSAVPYLDSL